MNIAKEKYLCAELLHTSDFSLYYKKMKAKNILNITLEYALSQFEEEIIDTIINEELTLEEKVDIIMSLDEESKRLILRKIGFKKEFLKTI